MVSVSDLDLEKVEVYEQVDELNKALAEGARLLAVEKLASGGSERLVFIVGRQRSRRVERVQDVQARQQKAAVQAKEAHSGVVAPAPASASAAVNYTGASGGQAQDKKDEPGKITEKQVSFITSLMSRYPELSADVDAYLDVVGAKELSELSRDQASELLDTLVDRSKSLAKTGDIKVTPKQKKLIMTLAEEKPGGQLLIDGYLAEKGVELLDDLTANQASELIALLKGSKKQTESEQVTEDAIMGASP